MKSLILYFLYFLILFFQPASAIRVSGLYQATITVSDESESKRRVALKQALGKVLVKVTGDRNINNSTTANLLHQRSEQFVQQYRYNQNTNEWGQDKSATELWVQFDENALDAALKTYGVNVWGKERPSILVWLVCQNDKNRYFASLENSSEYLNILEKRAAARGIRLLFPLLDLQDTSQISVTDVWGSFMEPIIKASNRYQPDAILAGKFSQILPALWESNWAVYMNEEVISWTTQSEIADIALEEGIDELIDKLVSQYSNIEKQDYKAVDISISNIDSLDRYAQAILYLKSLKSVTKVSVKRISLNYVVFELIGDQGIEGIQQAISLGKKLQFVEGSDDIEYRLLP